MDRYLYAVRNKTTGELEDARCNNGGKYYMRKKFAQNRCDEYNEQGYEKHYSSKGEFEVVIFNQNEAENSRDFSHEMNLRK